MIVNPITLLETCKNYEVDVNKKGKILTDDRNEYFLGHKQKIVLLICINFCL